MGATIIGTGKALPALRVSNDDLSKLVDTSDEWIVQRTGIHNRRIAVTETTTDLAATASAGAMGLPYDCGVESHGWTRAQVKPEDIDLVICMTVTADATVPSQAAMVRQRLGLVNAVCFDLNAACAGCVYGMVVAQQMMTASHLVEGGNQFNHVLVVAAERLTHITDWTDRTTCVLFGDGSGAAVLEWRDDEPGIMSSFLANTDDFKMTLTRRNPLSAIPETYFPFDQNGVVAEERESEAPREVDINPVGDNPFLVMNGRSVFKFATYAVVDAVHTVLDRAGVAIEDIACIVPHQANERIIAFAAKKLDLPLDLFQISIGEVGNSSSASAMMALCDAFEGGRIKPGDKAIMVGFGGGLTAGAILFQA